MNLKEIFSNEIERNKLDIFLKEKEECKGPYYHITGNINDPEENEEDSFYHISGKIEDPALIEIDDYYKVADKLSTENAKKHANNLLILPIIGISLTVIFFVYFELEVHFMILFCVLVLVLLDIFHRMAKKSESHRKYIEYRVLAESLRVQFFLSISGVKKEVRELLPWFTKQGIPWIEDILKDLPLDKVKEKQSIMHIWILDQKTYHEGALEKAEGDMRTEKKIRKIALYVTIIAYLGGLLFESIMYFCPPNLESLAEITFQYIMFFNPPILDAEFIHTWVKLIISEHSSRLLLKMIIGIMSISIIFIENYYGKMSLSERINDHKRMILLYRKVSDEIKAKGETEEIIVRLARECLNENSTWYAYQSKNKAEIVL